MATISTNNQPSPEQVTFDALIEVTNLCRDLYNKVLAEDSGIENAQDVAKGIEIVFNNIARAIEEYSAKFNLAMPMVQNEVAADADTVSDVRGTEGE